MIIPIVVNFAKRYIQNTYTDYQIGIQNKVGQFGVVEVELINFDNNCEQWLVNLFLLTRKNEIDAQITHNQTLKMIYKECKNNGVVVDENSANFFHVPQITVVNGIKDYYMHNIAIPVHRYEREDI